MRPDTRTGSSGQERRLGREEAQRERARRELAQRDKEREDTERQRAAASAEFVRLRIAKTGWFVPPGQGRF